VTRFLTAYPDVAVGLVLTDRIARFLDDQIDVALRIGLLPDSSLIATRLGSVRRVVCASPDYLAANGIPETLDDLSRHSVISLEGVSSTSSWSFRSGGVETTVTFRARLSVNTIDAAIAAGLAGAGLIRALSYQVVDYVRSHRMTIVLDAFEPPPPPVHLVYDARDRLPLKLRAFIDYVVPPLRERLAQAALQDGE
jgi:DNA-binding transcriptional LysR family regulator